MAGVAARGDTSPYAMFLLRLTIASLATLALALPAASLAADDVVFGVVEPTLSVDVDGASVSSSSTVSVSVYREVEAGVETVTVVPQD